MSKFHLNERQGSDQQVAEENDAERRWPSSTAPFNHRVLDSVLPALGNELSLPYMALDVN